VDVNMCVSCVSYDIIYKGRPYDTHTLSILAFLSVSNRVSTTEGVASQMPFQGRGGQDVVSFVRGRWWTGCVRTHT
jgi:hypothetical protein